MGRGEANLGRGGWGGECWVRTKKYNNKINPKAKQKIYIYIYIYNNKINPKAKQKNATIK